MTMVQFANSYGNNGYANAKHIAKSMNVILSKQIHYGSALKRTLNIFKINSVFKRLMINFLTW